jgi:hypothetical protein
MKRPLSKGKQGFEHPSSGTSGFAGAPCDERVFDISAKGFDKVREKITKYDEENK